jgi:hypothetical protein
VSIAAVGGTDAGTLGTSFAKIAAAIDEATLGSGRAVVLTDCERGDVLAAQLREAGVQVRAIVEQAGGGGMGRGTRNIGAGAAGTGGGVVHPGHLTGRIRRARGHKALRAVEVRTASGVRTIAADLLCVALRERPADDLVLQWEYVAAGDPNAVPGGWGGDRQPVSGLAVVGSAAGWTGDDPQRAHAAGAAAGQSAREQW